MDEHERMEQDDKGILDTVRRILSEDQSRATEPPTRDPRRAVTEPAGNGDVLELGPDMMIEPSPNEAAHTVPTNDQHLVNERTEDTARRSLGSLRDVMREQRAVATHRGGPTIEDIIRDEMRPLLREWLDTNLPPLVEKLVRSEIARIVERDGT